MRPALGRNLSFDTNSTPDVPIETIYYPLDTAVYCPRPRDAAKRAFGIEPSQKVIGFACDDVNNERKGLADLLEALRLLPHGLRSQSTLLTFGRDPSAKIRAEVDLSWVHLGFLNGEVAQVAAYSAMDLFVVPSRAEAFGLTALEAQAVGTPVVGTDVGGLNEAVVAGGLVLAGNESGPQALSDLIAKSLLDETILGERAKAGREMAVGRHSAYDCARTLNALFDSITK